MCTRAILYTILTFVTVTVSGQQELTKVFEEYSNCSTDDNCEDLFEQALVGIDVIASDTARAESLLKLGEIRQDIGVWDDRVEELYIEAKETFEDAGFVCGQARAVRERCSFRLTSEVGNMGMELANEAVDLAKVCGDKEILAICYATLGVAYYNAGEYAAALEAHSKELRLYQELGNKEMEAVSNQELSYIYAAMEDYERANLIMLKSARLFKEMGLELRYANCITDLCLNYLDQNASDSVINRLPPVIEIYRRENYAIGKTISIYNLGEAYLLKKDYSKALELYAESAEICADIDFPRFLMEIEISKSQCYTGIGDHKSAYKFIKKAEKLAEETSNFEGLLNVYKYKMDAARKVGEYDASYEAGLEYIELKDSLRSLERDEKVAAMQEELEAEKREREIVILEQEKSLETQQKNGLLIIVFLVIGAAGGIINRESQRRKKSKQLHLAELKIKEADERLLREELDFKKRELASKVLHISQKNEVLENLRNELQKLSNHEEADQSVRDILNQLKIERSIDENWEEFTHHFQNVNPDFYKRLKSQSESITKNDLRLAALLRMNLNTKEIASVLNISPEGVKKARHRFRKKLEIESDESLTTFILNL